MAVDLTEMCSEFFVNFKVVAFTIQVHVQFAEDRTVRIGVADPGCLARPRNYFQQVIEPLRATDLRLEKSFFGYAIGGKPAFRTVPIQYRYRLGIRSEHADDEVLIDLMHSKNAKRIVVFSLQEPVEVVGVDSHRLL